MAPDNTLLNEATSSGDLISTDELAGGLKVQRVKVQHGDDGTATDTSASNPLPVLIQGEAAPVQVDYRTILGTTPSTDTVGGFTVPKTKVQFGEAGVGIDVSYSRPMPTMTLPEVAALGLDPALDVWQRFGEVGDVDVGPGDTVWSPGGTWLETPNTSPETLSVVSTSGADTAAGTGVQQVIVYGVDSNYDRQTELVTLNGTTPVATTQTFIGADRMRTAAVGSGNEAAGTIQTTGGTSGLLYSEIPAGENSSYQATQIIPRDTKGLVYGFYADVNDAQSGTVATFTPEFYEVDGAAAWIGLRRVSIGTGQMFWLPAQIPFPLTARSYIRIHVTTDSNNTQVRSGFGMVIRSL